MKAARPAYVIHLMMSASWQTLVWDEIHLGRMAWQQALISPPKAPMPTKPSEDKTIESRPLSSALPSFLVSSSSLSDQS